MSVEDNYASVLERIGAAARRAGRASDEVRVVAVSKSFPPDVIAAAIEAGVRELGENRAQELRQKVAVLGDRATWHFVGHLQTNKVRQVVGSVAMIHSVDRFGVAEAVARRATRLGLIQDVLIEVNVVQEEAKHGVEPGRALDLAERVAALDGLRVRGLMAMSSYPDDPEDSRPAYKELAALGGRLAEALPEATQLSMGMTRDFEVAVEEGATIVRVGEAIFGPRASR